MKTLSRPNTPPAPKRESRYYQGHELKPYSGRPDAVHALSLPSRTGNRLRYRDGRVTDFSGNTLNTLEQTT